MEGKEVRFGIANSALFAVVTTDASCGAVNTMHDSLTPLGGLVPLVNIELGEVVFGGVGAGLYGMLIFAILAVFIAGLMVGRTPEYLGKKIEQKEVKMVMLAVLVLAVCILGFAAAGIGQADASGRQHDESTGRTGSPKSSTPTPAASATTAAPSGAQREHAMYFNTHHRPRHAVRPVPDDHSAAGRGRQPGAEEDWCRFRRARSPRTGRCLWCCWWASS